MWAKWFWYHAGDVVGREAAQPKLPNPHRFGVSEILNKQRKNVKSSAKTLNPRFKSSRSIKFSFFEPEVTVFYLFQPFARLIVKGLTVLTFF